MEIFEEISRADGSAGWTVVIGNSTTFFAWLDPAAAKEMIGGNPNFVSTSMWAPAGQAVPDEALLPRHPHSQPPHHLQRHSRPVLARRGCPPMSCDAYAGRVVGVQCSDSPVPKRSSPTWRIPLITLAAMC